MGDVLTVWLVEDDPAFRTSMEAVFQHEPGAVATGAFGSVAEVLAQPAAAAPDVLLLDINMPGTSGLDGLVALRQRFGRTRIIMLTVHDEPEIIFRALERGASGYLVKGAPSSVVMRSVHEAAQGGMLLPPPVARRLAEHFRTRTAGDYGLTPREHEVLRLMCDGLSQPQIAERLFVSPATVNTHVQTLYEKLHVHTGTGAVAKAFRERLI